MKARQTKTTGQIATMYAKRFTLIIFLRVSRVRLDREAIGQRGKHRLPFVHTALENLSKWRLGEPINPRLRYDDSMRIYFTKERTHG